MGGGSSPGSWPHPQCLIAELQPCQRQEGPTPDLPRGHGRSYRSGEHLCRRFQRRLGLIPVLAFLSGLLLMALAGMVVLQWQRQSAIISASPTSPDTAPNAEPPPTPSPSASPTPVKPATAASQLASPEGVATVDHAVAGIQKLYQALSAKDFSQAQALYGSATADQFDHSFFRQFERVSVQDLRATCQTGSTVNLEGVVTFVWPDGSLQTETRTFSVNASSTPAVIAESEFGRVLTPRR